jgi:putative transposase
MHYHLVFTVKYRRALLSPQVVAELSRISLDIQERHEFQIEALGADKDHVHLLCAAHPKIAGADTARIYKSLTARELFKAMPALRKELWGGAFWTSSYFCATVSEDGLAPGQFGGYESVNRYVEQGCERRKWFNRPKGLPDTVSGAHRRPSAWRSRAIGRSTAGTAGARWPPLPLPTSRPHSRY